MSTEYKLGKLGEGQLERQVQELLTQQQRLQTTKNEYATAKTYWESQAVSLWACESICEFVCEFVVSPIVRQCVNQCVSPFVSLFVNPFVSGVVNPMVRNIEPPTTSLSPVGWSYR